MVVLIYIGMNSDLFQLFKQGEIDDILETLSQNLFLTLGIMLLFMVVQNTATFIPLLLLITLNVALFGFLYGYMWSWITSVMGATFAFTIVRYLFQPVFSKMMNPKVKAKIEKNGFVFVLICRILPFMPTSVINIASGVSSIRFRSYLLATVLGNMIYMFMLSLLPLGLFSVEWDVILYIILAFGIVLTYIGYLIYKKKRSRSASLESEKEQDVDQ